MLPNTRITVFLTDWCTYEGCCITSDIWAAVLPLAPSITIAKADEMLKGEKKTLAVLSSSLNFFSKAWEKAVLASGRGAGDAIISEDKEQIVDSCNDR